MKGGGFMKPQAVTSQRDKLRRRIDAAMGRQPCDLVLRNARYFDVFSACFREGEIAIADGVIVGLESGRRAARVIDLSGKSVVPGFIDAHVHVESSMMLPSAFESAVLPHGTTTAICDPHELANVVGVPGLRYFLSAAEGLSLDLWVMLSSCVPATQLETNGGGSIDAAALAHLASHPRALGLAEMMSFLGLLAGEEGILDKLVAFGARPLDGHCPLLMGGSLSAYAASGVSSCHEASRLDEAQEKLTRGMAVWIREGSVAKDLRALAPLLTLQSSTSVGFCTDDRNPFDIAGEGHIDYLVRTAIRLGVAPEAVYRAASWSAAQHYGLTRGEKRFGAVAPAYQADLVILDDVPTCAIAAVLKGGRLVSELPEASPSPAELTGTMRASVPNAEELVGPSGMVHVIVIIPGKIITERRILRSNDAGVLRLSVLERHGHGGRPANAYVTGLGPLEGAIASSVGHDSHNLIVVGSDVGDMRSALAALIASGGGFCVVQNGAVLAHMPLEQAGLMSSSGDPAELARAIRQLKDASRAIGCTLDDPFLQLAFLSLPVIPSLKLTDRGLVDVDRMAIIDVRAA
jgi:adenine deaminase